MSSAKSLWLCALGLSLVPSLASADESPAATAKQRVEEGLLKPLAEKEKDAGRFTRARMPPRERRVRVTQATTTADKHGGGYLPFAIDVRWGDEWHQNDIVGCAYLKTGALFVKRGDEYRPASVLLGKSAEAVAGVCTPGAKERA